MTTDLNIWQPPQAPVAALIDYQTRAVQRLSDWVQSADAAYQVAQRLVQSSFVPQQFRDKPIEATAAILAGSEIGLSPMAALRAFDVIQGTASPKAITLRAIVLSFGHEIELVESTATRCVMRGRRRGSVTWQTVTWTLDRAKDLGLTGKDQWKKQPGTMLVARCTSEISRLIAADAILGIGYTTEELIDGADPSQPVESSTEPPAAPEPEQPATRKMSRPKAEPEPEPAPVESDLWLISDAQRKKLMATYSDAGLTDRDKALAWTSWLLKREVVSRKTLTPDEASQTIDALMERIEQQRVEVVEPTFDGLDDQ